MDTSTQLILVALLAFGLGVFTLVAIQLRATLRTLQGALERTDARFDALAAETQQILQRVDRVTAGFEGADEPAHRLLAALDDLAETAQTMQQRLRVAGAVLTALGPAAVAAARAWQASTRAPPEPDPSPRADPADRDNGSVTSPLGSQPAAGDPVRAH